MAKYKETRGVWRKEDQQTTECKYSEQGNEVACNI